MKHLLSWHTEHAMEIPIVALDLSKIKINKMGAFDQSSI
jgi:hypothetical protein